MSLLMIFEKIWQYLGLFYLSLGLFVAGCFFSRFKRLIIFLVLGLNLVLAGRSYVGRLKEWRLSIAGLNPLFGLGRPLEKNRPLEKDRSLEKGWFLGKGWSLGESRSLKEKMNQASGGQYRFLEQVEPVLGGQGRVCYPWPNDVAGSYAEQFLYPRSVKLTVKNLADCGWLVIDHSVRREPYPVEKELTEADQLVLDSGSGQVYLLKQPRGDKNSNGN